MPQLARILIYPLKSFDPVEVPLARVLPSGALEHDRRWALYDPRGNWINGKNNVGVHPVRVRFDEHVTQVTLEAEGRQATFSLGTDLEEPARWLGDVLKVDVSIREDRERGQPDDPTAPGPTLISSETLAAVAGWFPGMSLDESRRRFRANLEIAGDEPFWEDRLYGQEGESVRFRIGGVEFLGVNPCARCIVPQRDSITGRRTPEFAQVFEERRYETLPYWATRARFDHFYRVAVNTCLAQPKGGIVRVGDTVELLAE